MRCLFISILLSAAPAFGALTITAPAANTTAAPGQTITVTVDSGGTSYQFVGLNGEGPLGPTPLAAAPPYSFSLTIPANIAALRKYAVTAVGNLGPSRNDASTPIPIDVERADPPVGVKAEISYLEMAVSEKSNMTITGIFADGASFDVTRSTRTTYVSSNPGVATVSADGIVTAVAPGTCKLAIDGILVVPVAVRAPIEILPQFAATYPNWTRQFSAPVANAANNTAVRWSVSPAGLGSVDGNGVYHAPPSVTAPEFVTVTAASVADSTVAASATVMLSPAIVAAISPAAATVSPSQVQVFQAQLTNDINDLGDANSGVLWSVTPAGVGAILQSTPFYFVYQAPAAAPATVQKVTIKATSITDPSKSATAVVTLGH